MDDVWPSCDSPPWGLSSPCDSPRIWRSTSGPVAPAALARRSRFRSSQIRREQFPDFLRRLSQDRIRIERPGDGNAHEDDMRQPREFGGWEIAPNFARLLSQRKNFGHQPPPPTQALLQMRADRGAGQMRRKNRPEQVGALGRLAGEVGDQLLEDIQHRPFA